MARSGPSVRYAGGPFCVFLTYSSEVLCLVGHGYQGHSPRELSTSVLNPSPEPRCWRTHTAAYGWLVAPPGRTRRQRWGASVVVAYTLPWGSAGDAGFHPRVAVVKVADSVAGSIQRVETGRVLRIQLSVQDGQGVL